MSERIFPPLPPDEGDGMQERLTELAAANEALRREIEQFRRFGEGLSLGEERYRSLVEA